jgi:hypothetical protein
MVRTMEILREYCLNDQPVQLEVLSDQTVNFPRFCRRPLHPPPCIFHGCPDCDVDFVVRL